MPASQIPRICALLLAFNWSLAAYPVFSQEAPAEAQEQTQPSQPTTPSQKEEKPLPRQRFDDPKRESWAILEEAATGEKSGERAAAIRALGLMPRDSRAAGMAEKALKDDKPEVRTAAALALGDMQAKSSIPALKAATDDPEPSVALAAGQALCVLHDPAAYDVYYEVLTGERKTGTGLIASQKAILRDPKKLASIGIAEGVGFIPFGGLGWEAIKSLTKDDASPIRASAAKVLASDPDPASTKALENAAGDKSWIVRAGALEALAKRGDPSALKTVELYTYDEKDVVKYTAAAAYLHLSAIRDNPPPSGAKRKARAKVSGQK